MGTPQTLRWRHRWPTWVAPAAFVWALSYAGVQLVAAVAGRQWGLDFRGAAWVSAVLLLLCCTAVGATIWPWGRRLPRRAVTVALATTTVLAVVGGFGLAMSLVEMFSTGRATGPDGQRDLARLTAQASFGFGAVLLLGTTLSWRHRVRRTCPRCGRAHQPDDALAVVHPPPTVPTARVRRLAYVGIACIVPYVVAKSVIAIGGTVAGLSADDVGEYAGAAGWLHARGVDVTAVFAVLGIILLLALTHRWGFAPPRWCRVLSARRMPRWLLLVPGWVGAVTLAPYGVAMLAMLPLLSAGVLDHGLTISRWWVAIGGAAFGPFGCALALATASYQRRTRPRCLLAAAPAVASEIPSAPPVPVSEE
jgi:hypothetical protein